MPPEPVKVILGDAAFCATVTVPLTEAVGNGLTVTVTDCPVMALFAQLAPLPDTAVKVYTALPEVPVAAVSVTEFPDVVVIVWSVPLPI